MILLNKIDILEEKCFFFSLAPEKTKNQEKGSKAGLQIKHVELPPNSCEVQEHRTIVLLHTQKNVIIVA